jgi:RHS repeat-associated protein
VRPDATNGDKTYRVITDHLGSPIYVVNIADPSDVLLDATYDEWGQVVSYTSSTGAWPIPFGFAGGLYDEDTGLVRFGARDYDPRVGRWTAKDPILFGGGQANLYVYVGNDPVNFVDPLGLYNLVKGGVGAINSIRGVLSVATGAAAIISGTASLPFVGVNVVGVGAIGIGAVQVGLGIGNISRGTQQLGEAMNEEWGDASGRNLLGLAPFGQEFDDPWEPGPVEYFKSAAQNFDASDWVRDFFALGPAALTNSGRRDNGGACE